MNCFLLTALISKAKGQYLRVALTMHALFQSAPLQDDLPRQIPEKAIRAAVCLVRLCNFHTAIIAGREISNGSITSPIQVLPMPSMVQPLDDERKLQQLVLSQPGPIVSASRMTNVSKFRSNGGKQRVLLTFNSIANKQLASLSHKKGNVSSQFSNNSNG